MLFKLVHEICILNFLVHSLLLEPFVTGKNKAWNQIQIFLSDIQRLLL